MVRLTLRAVVDDRGRGALLGELSAAIAAAPTTVWIDLCALGPYDPGLRGLLLAVTQAIVAQRGRTVYVADRPRLRGLALWVVHMAEDPAAKIVGDNAAALAWLRRTEPRLATAEEGALAALAGISGGSGSSKAAHAAGGGE